MEFPFKLLEEADKSFADKEFKKAEALYSHVIERYTVDQQKNYHEASKCLCKAYNNRGQIKYLRVDFSEAIEDYTKALSINPKFETALYNRGLIHYRLGRYTQAIEDYQACLKISPDFQDCIEGIRVAQMEQDVKGNRVW